MTALPQTLPRTDSVKTDLDPERLDLLAPRRFDTLRDLWARGGATPQLRRRWRFRIGLVLSLLLHALIVFGPWRLQPEDAGEPVQTEQGPLSVRLSRPAAASPAQPEPPAPAPAPKPRPQPAERPKAVIALKRPSAPGAFTVPARDQAEPAPVAPDTAPPLDMMAAINAKRQQRQASEASAARENADAQDSSSGPSANDVALANINRNLQSLQHKKDGTNGIFQILSKGTRTGQFSFRGWTPNSSSTWREVIDVDAGLHGDVELAMVRRMIDLIRTHYPGDFNWDSRRLGRVVVMSARPADSAALEAFLMREFFGPDIAPVRAP